MILQIFVRFGINISLFIPHYLLDKQEYTRSMYSNRFEYMYYARYSVLLRMRHVKVCHLVQLLLHICTCNHCSTAHVDRDK